MSACFRFTTLAVFFFALPLLGTPLAHAICTPDVIYKRYVGNVATDSLCTDDDIQSAINNAVCPSVIYITDEHTYTAQHLDINNKNLTLVGTTSTCGPQTCDAGCVPPTTPQVVIDGAGHSSDSVMYIHGQSNVTLKYLRIRNGNNIIGANATYGGGIHFDGRGSLVLDTVTVNNNLAQFGGGINFNGNGGFAGLTVLGNTQIIGNTAGNSGGGIRVSGNAFMSLLYDKTAVWSNHAPNGYGGGINIVGPARADIGSPGFAGLGVLYLNDAKYGGGIASTASSDGKADVNLYTTDPLRPVRLQGNTASDKGGAVYLKGHDGGLGSIRSAQLCAFDFRIDYNLAAEGSAIYADLDPNLLGDIAGSHIYLNTIANLCAAPVNAQRCDPGVTCNTISDNDSEDAAGNPTLGAAIYLARTGIMVGTRLEMRRNVGGYAIRHIDPYIEGDGLSNCLLVDNAVSRRLVSLDSGRFTFDNCTIANNTILSTDTIYAGGPLTLTNLIIDQPDNLSLAYAGSSQDRIINFVLATDVTTLPGTGVRTGRPTYINAAAGDYHLALASQGLDFAPPRFNGGTDLDRRARDIDLPEVANFFGVRDLGAYERQRGCGANDTIYCNGFDSP